MQGLHPFMNDLKLFALDTGDLAILSAQLQDAVVRVDDLAYDARGKRFAAILNRFNWMRIAEQKKLLKEYERRQCGLRIERVLSVRSRNIDRSQGETVLSLLAICFSADETPGGHITLEFSGGAAIELNVECIEVELRDLGAAWSTNLKPIHPESG